MNPQIRDVVCCICFAPDGKLLINQRPKGKFGALKWEFPGGKIEEGESHQEALCREMREELNVALNPDLLRFFDGYTVSHFSVHFYLYRAPEALQPQAMEEQEFAWVEIKDLNQYDFLDANQPILKKIQREMME